MIKLNIGFILLLSLMYSGCLDILNNENYPESYIRFAKINADSTGYRAYFEIANMPQYNQDLINYIISSNQEFLIMNYGLLGLIRHDLEDNWEMKISGNRWVRGCQPDISPDNGRVVFASEGDIFLVNSDGSDLTNITNTSEDYDSYPSFTEDGLNIVFSSNLNYLENDSLYAIYKTTLDGSETSEICTLENEDYRIIYPLWSDQYDRFLFHYICSDSYYDSLSGVWEYQNGSPLQVYSCNPKETKLMITSDGEKIITHSSGDGLIIDITGNLLFDTRTISYGLDSVFLSEDGSFLMYRNNDNTYIYEFASQLSKKLVNNSHKVFLIGDQVYFFEEHIYF